MIAPLDEIPFDVQLLRFCRCMDCENHQVDLAWSPDGNAHRCKAGVGGSMIVWGTGEIVTEPTIDAWHYCSDYIGQVMVDDVLLWPRQAGASTAAPPPVEQEIPVAQPAKQVREPAKAPTPSRPLFDLNRDAKREPTRPHAPVKVY